MSRLNDRVNKLESAAPPASFKQVRAWIQSRDGSVRSRDGDGFLSPQEWAEYLAGSDGLDIVRVIVAPVKQPNGAAPVAEQ